MFRLHINPFFAVDDSATITPKSLGKDEIFKALNEDDKDDEKIDLSEEKEDKKEEKEEKVEAKSKKDDEEKEEEPDELDELEEELEEPDEEKLELSTPVRRGEILKKYPALFKDFPYLEKAYYREQQFTEIYPTIAEAKEGKEKSDVLDQLEQDVKDGNVERIIAASVSGKSFNKLIDNLLPTIQKIDNNAYLHIAANFIKQTVISMVREAKASNNDVLQNAAQILNQYAFGSSEWTPPTKLSGEEVKDNSEENKLKNERMEFSKQRYELANDGLNEKINNAILSTIKTNIDPKESMNDWTRNNAIRECQEEISELLESDKRFSTLIDKLWENAVKNNYDSDSMGKIKAAFFSKAKMLLPSAIKKARNNALRGMGKRVVEEKEEETTTSSRNNRSPLSRDHAPIKDGPKKGESSLEYLMRS